MIRIKLRELNWKEILTSPLIIAPFRAHPESQIQGNSKSIVTLEMDESKGCIHCIRD